MRDRIFKLNPIHATVIFRFPEFAEFSESSALFRKSFNIKKLVFWHHLMRLTNLTTIKREMRSCFAVCAETFVNCYDVHICDRYIQHLWTSARRGGWALIRVPREKIRLSPSTNPCSTLSSDDRDDSHDGRKRETGVVLFVTASWPFVASHPPDHTLFNIQCSSLLVAYNFLDSNVTLKWKFELTFLCHV